MGSAQMEFYGTTDFFTFFISMIEDGTLARMTEKNRCVASVFLVLKKHLHNRSFRDWGTNKLPSKKILMKESGATLHYLNGALDILEEEGFIRSIGYVKTIKGRNGKEVQVKTEKAGGRGVVKEYEFMDKIKIYGKNDDEVMEAGEILMPLNPKQHRKQQGAVANALYQLNQGIIPTPDKDGLIKVEVKKEVKQIILQVNVDGASGTINNIGTIGDDGNLDATLDKVDEIGDGDRAKFQQVLNSFLNEEEMNLEDAIKEYNKTKRSRSITD